MLPLLRPNLYSSFFLVVAPTLSEITLSSLLWSVGNETIGTVVFSTQEEGKILLTAALAVVLITLVVVINYLVRWLSGDDMGI
jgi:iron(III) transport system permease protein